ncbi:hypothetical protein FPY71_11545 [Aureimonas fodinaquatilis]|uniref:Uncharacterized protein n=1 Tax=Aureimonas fodinaquatilis TaxID=2565783 RepID=A0A5B0DYI3_9HYPH|nr:hypothetical protein [Aureimonas fodinaquatilis]KAA0971072.1 hypothetical protein FPY71_11545 [Aureimonas fodinaquatilis]
MPAIDRFASAAVKEFAPATAVFAVTPHDVNELAYVTNGIYVGGAGDIVLVDKTSGTAVTFKAVPAGSILPVRTAKINATSTTATHIVGLA